MLTKELIEQSSKYLCFTYNRYPIVFSKGKGCKLWDVDGKEYLDFVAGLAVVNLGHCHPSVVRAIKEQAEKLIHVSNYYHNEPMIELARLLCENSFAEKVFFCNSGAEANEAAIKLARKYAKENLGKEKFEIITMLKSFHGRTMATITATGQERFHKGFEPLLEGFKYVPFNDLEALRRAITEKTCAIMMEPIQGEGGVNVPSKEYIQGLRRLCDEKGLLLIFDEVQTGIGRTGKLFAYEYFGIEPDIMTLAKGLANGIPIGAMLTKDKFASAFVPGAHASTFGGNPLATAAALAVLHTIKKEDILRNCNIVSGYLINRLKELMKGFDFIKDVRGIGLLIGMELTFDAGDIVKKCMDRGILINYTNGNVLRFIPPLIVMEDEVDVLITALEEIFLGIAK
ncbi:MAG: acetylornithine transaminase [Deltaproteobacteria bacterium]